MPSRFSEKGVAGKYAMQMPNSQGAKVGFAALASVFGGNNLQCIASVTIQVIRPV